MGGPGACCTRRCRRPASSTSALDHLHAVLRRRRVSCRPLLSTAITRPPMIDPATVPIPPETAAPPMNTADDRRRAPSPDAVTGAGGDRARDPHHAGERRDERHVRHHEEVDAADVHTGELGRAPVAADRVDVPADRGVVGEERVADRDDAEDDARDRVAGADPAGREEVRSRRPRRAPSTTSLTRLTQSGARSAPIADWARRSRTSCQMIATRTSAPRMIVGRFAGTPTPGRAGSRRR